MPFNEEDKVTKNELAPDIQEIFSALITHKNNARQNLTDYINDKTQKLDGFQDVIDQLTEDQLGLAGVTGRVVKVSSPGKPFYCDDHFFTCKKLLEITDTNEEYLYKYNFYNGTYVNLQNNLNEIPWRSFLYDKESEQLWFYYYPGKYEEIKGNFIKNTALIDSSSSTVGGAIRLIDSGMDTYDSHDRYFKVYSNGWCEQSGAYAHSGKLTDKSNFIHTTAPDSSGNADDHIYYNRYVKFQIPFRDTNYLVTHGGELWLKPGSEAVCSHGYAIYRKYTDKMHVAVCGGGPNAIKDIHWKYSTYRAEGFVDLKALGYI